MDMPRLLTRMLPTFDTTRLATESDLATLASELAVVQPAVPGMDKVRHALEVGDDPLGEAFCRLRSAKTRRKRGAVYTPRAIVSAMVDWASRHAAASTPPDRIVDPGAGSGRFLLAAARKFPKATLVAVEIDPLAILLLRANARLLDLQDRLTIVKKDYRAVQLPEIEGSTLFLGNPPYVRHHEIPAHWKQWFGDQAGQLGIKASKLAGLHVHFLLKTRELARDGDFGAFITAAEWLDVNYGGLVRRLLIGHLGGISVHAIAAASLPFSGTATTGAVFNFCVGRTPAVMRFRAVRKLDSMTTLGGGTSIPRSRAAGSDRWSEFLRPRAARPSGSIELGELIRVHRGQVTGCNRAWITGSYREPLPGAVLLPAVTRALELFNAGPALRDCANLRRVIVLPANLDDLDETARATVSRFLLWAKSLGADESYVARHRRAWWAVSLKAPAPILCTYMARRSPAFVRNLCGARHLNIAHGLYPRDPLPEVTLDALAQWLRNNVGIASGRTYAGGLTKFEPREVERIRIPPPEELHVTTTTLDHRRAERRRRTRQAFVPAVAAD